VKASKVYRQGIAIDMIVDVSRSMAMLDFQFDGSQNNRLEVVKQAFRQFVQGGASLAGRDSDLVGMVTFARYADSISPLTLDHQLLLTLLDTIDIVTLPEENGTAIGEAIALGAERLSNSSAASRVMILLTDGANNAGDVEPLQAARIAKALRIKIYTIGVGTGGMATVAVPAHDGRLALRSMPVLIDEPTLNEIATITGGQYFRATDGAALQAIYAEIDRLEKTWHALGHYQQKVEGFPLLLLASLALLVLEVVLANTCCRTIP
jgi:Ca-activated chloride channel family protein